MQEVAEAGLDQLPAVGLLVDVGDGDEAVGDGLLDDGGADLGRDLETRLRHLVDPHLDEVDPLAGQGADHLARFLPSEVGCWAPALKPPGCVKPRPAVNMRGVSGRPALASSISATCSASSVPMLRAVVTP